MDLIHDAVWRKVGPKPADAGGVDGSGDLSERAVKAFFDPLTPAIAETRYGVVGTERPHLVFLDPEFCQPVENDVLEWKGREFVVRSVRQWDTEDGEHIEAVASARTKGRG